MAKAKKYRAPVVRSALEAVKVALDALDHVKAIQAAVVRGELSLSKEAQAQLACARCDLGKVHGELEALFWSKQVAPGGESK